MTMTITQSQRDAAHRIAYDIPDIDSTLPNWARRRNPIVLRMLGEHWRVFMPEIKPLLQIFAYQTALVLATILFPWLYIVLLTFLLPAAMILPYAFYLYAQAIVRTIQFSSNGMAAEYEHDTLKLLRTTPFSTREIILSKMMAAVWRQADELDQILSYAAYITVPVLTTLYLSTWPPDDFNGVNQALTLTVFAASLLRIPLEVFMVASIGTLMGTYTRLRSTAFMAAMVLVFFYFLLVNLMRLVEMDWQMQIIVDAVIPLVLPIIITWVTISLTVQQIEQD